MDHANRKPIIKAEDLFVTYNEGKPNEIKVMEDVSLEIYPQEYVIIYGPSGCGKSTLLNLLSGLLSPTRGKVEVAGEDISGYTKKQKVKFRQGKIGMVFQSFFLVPTLKIIDNVCLPKIFLGEDEEARRKTAEHLLERFGITPQAEKFPSELSGGQKQRVAIARALVNNPDIVFADEPVGNLDSKASFTVMSILTELNEVDKKTIILVTHDPSHLSYGDKVVYMSDGKIVKIEETVKKMAPHLGNLEEQHEKDEVIQEWESFKKGKLGHAWELYKKGELEKKWDLVEKEELGKAWNAFNKQLGEEWKLGKDWELVKKDEFEKRTTISPEIEMLSKSFKNLSSTQMGMLFIPFKAEQIFYHVFFHKPSSEIEEMKKMFQDTLAGRLTLEGFEKKLDMDKAKGGLGLDKRVAARFAAEVKIIMDLAAKIDYKNTYQSADSLAQYLAQKFEIDLAEIKYRLIELVKNRLDNKISVDEFLEAAILPAKKRGLGLAKNVSLKVARELEILILTKYGE